MIWALGQQLPIYICIIIDFVLGALGAVIFDHIYHHGIIHVTEGRDGKPDRYLFEFNVDPDIIRQQHVIIFKVKKEHEQS